MKDDSEPDTTTDDPGVPQVDEQTDYDQLPIDHGWAYMTVLGCFGVCALVVGMVKSFGVILVELSRRFNVPASVLIGPQCLAGFFHLSLGPVANALSERYSHRLVVFVGGVLTAIALVGTSFVQSVPAFYITYGVLAGVGFGLCLSPSITFQGFHFRKRRALANGLAGSGSGAGSFALPTIIRVLINYYGLGGCLLLVGAVMLHVCVFCSLFRPPSYWKLYNRAKESSRKRNTDNTTKDDRNIHLNNGTTLPLLDKTVVAHSDEEYDLGRIRSDTNADINNGRMMPSLHTQYNKVADGLLAKSTVTTHDTEHHLSTSSLPITSHAPVNSTDATRPRTESALWNSNDKHTVLTSNQLTRSLLFASIESVPSLTEFRHLYSVQESKDTETNVINKKKPLLEWSLLKSPTYLVFIFAIFTGVMGQHSLFNILPSVANERGFTDREGAIIVSILGAADLVGRIGFGWVADLAFLERQTIFQINLMVFAVLVFIVPHVTSFVAFCIFSVLLGGFSGGYTGIQLAVLADKVGVDKLSSAWGFAAAFASVALLVSPFLSGVIRDVTGSWLGALRLGAGVAAVGSGSLVVEAILVRIVQ